MARSIDEATLTASLPRSQEACTILRRGRRGSHEMTVAIFDQPIQTEVRSTLVKRIGLLAQVPHPL